MVYDSLSPKSGNPPTTYQVVAGSLGHWTWALLPKGTGHVSRLRHLYHRGDGLSNAVPNRKGDTMVWVNPYHRIRFGKLEHVCGHFRGLPR